ncbi:hypothetical protein CEXT_210621, partial [Caerostris extrusa]
SCKSCDIQCVHSGKLLIHKSWNALHISILLQKEEIGHVRQLMSDGLVPIQEMGRAETRGRL